MAAAAAEVVVSPAAALTFDGVAQPAQPGWWSSSSWFADAPAVAAGGGAAAAAPGGAASQNRLCGGAAQRNPFVPASSRCALAEGAARDDLGRSAELGGAARWAAAGPGRTCGEAAAAAARAGGVPRAAAPALDAAIGAEVMEEVARRRGLEELRSARVALLGPLSASVASPPPRPQPQPPRARATVRARAAPRPPPPAAAEASWRVPPRAAASASDAVWTPFRLSSGALVYAAADSPTPDGARRWAAGEEPWPALAALSLDSAARARLRASQPGPILEGEPLRAARAEIAAWAAQEAEQEQQRIIVCLAAAAAADAARPEARLRRLLEAERAYANALEAALARAGLPLPARAA